MKSWVGGAPLGTAVQMVQSAQLYRLYHCTKGVASVEMLPKSGASPSGESPPEPHENFAVSDFGDSTSIEEADDTNSAVGVNDWRDRLL